MKKHFLIKSIRRDEHASEREGWTNYSIKPVTAALQALPNMIDDYNKDERKFITYEVYGVKGQETAVITVCGPRARVKHFPTALATTNFYEYFSLREVEYPETYL